MRALLILLLLCLMPGQSFAQKAAAAREAAEFLSRKFSKDAAKIGTAKLATRLETLAVQHGDEVFTVVKRCGPQALHVVEQGGSQAVRLMAKYGDDALRLAAKPKVMGMIAKHGDDCAVALLKHGAVAEPLIESVGKPAVSALKSVSTQNGRRLAMLADEGKLAPGLLDVVVAHGDKAADFIWRNKGALAVGVGLTAFLANPVPFVSGAENLVKPVVELPSKVAVEVAKGTNWTIVFLAIAALIAVPASVRWWLHRKVLKL